MDLSPMTSKYMHTALASIIGTSLDVILVIVTISNTVAVSKFSNSVFGKKLPYTSFLEE